MLKSLFGEVEQLGRRMWFEGYESNASGDVDVSYSTNEKEDKHEDENDESIKSSSNNENQEKNTEISEEHVKLVDELNNSNITLEDLLATITELTEKMDVENKNQDEVKLAHHDSYQELVQMKDIKNYQNFVQKQVSNKLDEWKKASGNNEYYTNNPHQIGEAFNQVISEIKTAVEEAENENTAKNSYMHGEFERFKQVVDAEKNDVTKKLASKPIQQDVKPTKEELENIAKEMSENSKDTEKNKKNYEDPFTLQKQELKNLIPKELKETIGDLDIDNDTDKIGMFEKHMKTINAKLTELNKLNTINISRAKKQIKVIKEELSIVGDGELSNDNKKTIEAKLDESAKNNTLTPEETKNAKNFLNEKDIKESYNNTQKILNAYHLNKIKDIQSFDDLDSWLEDLDAFDDSDGKKLGIKGSEKNAYSASDISVIIDEVKNGKALLNDITRTAGLRAKVKDLLEQNSKGTSERLEKSLEESKNNLKAREDLAEFLSDDEKVENDKEIDKHKRLIDSKEKTLKRRKNKTSENEEVEVTNDELLKKENDLHNEIYDLKNNIKKVNNILENTNDEKTTKILLKKLSEFQDQLKEKSEELSSIQISNETNDDTFENTEGEKDEIKLENMSDGMLENKSLEVRKFLNSFEYMDSEDSENALNLKKEIFKIGKQINKEENKNKRNKLNILLTEKKGLIRGINKKYKKESELIFMERDKIDQQINKNEFDKLLNSNIRAEIIKGNDLSENFKNMINDIEKKVSYLKQENLNQNIYLKSNKYDKKKLSNINERTGMIKSYEEQLMKLKIKQVEITKEKITKTVHEKKMEKVDRKIEQLKGKLDKKELRQMNLELISTKDELRKEALKGMYEKRINEFDSAKTEIKTLLEDSLQMIDSDGLNKTNWVNRKYTRIKEGKDGKVSSDNKKITNKLHRKINKIMGSLDDDDDIKGIRKKDTSSKFENLIKEISKELEKAAGDDAANEIKNRLKDLSKTLIENKKFAQNNNIDKMLATVSGKPELLDTMRYKNLNIKEKDDVNNTAVEELIKKYNILEPHKSIEELNDAIIATEGKDREKLIKTKEYFETVKTELSNNMIKHEEKNALVRKLQKMKANRKLWNKFKHNSKTIRTALTAEEGKYADMKNEKINTEKNAAEKREETLETSNKATLENLQNNDYHFTEKELKKHVNVSVDKDDDGKSTLGKIKEEAENILTKKDLINDLREFMGSNINNIDWTNTQLNAKNKENPILELKTLDGRNVNIQQNIISLIKEKPEDDTIKNFKNSLSNNLNNNNKEVSYLMDSRDTTFKINTIETQKTETDTKKNLNESE